MIKSELLTSIIELTIEGEKFEDLLFKQIQYLAESKEEHTGIGLYVYFEYDKEIEKYRLSKSQLEELFGKFNYEFTKFELVNSKVNVLAELSVHIEEGLIECVEIWNKLGNYPKDELLTYEIKRL